MPVILVITVEAAFLIDLVVHIKHVKKQHLDFIYGQQYSIRGNYLEHTFHSSLATFEIQALESNSRMGTPVL